MKINENLLDRAKFRQQNLRKSDIDLFHEIEILLAK